MGGRVMEIAITGVGLLHPHGRSLEDLGRAFARQTTPPRQIDAPESDLPVQGPPSRSRRMDRVSQYAASAALLALQHAGAELLGEAAGRAALVGGTMFGGLEACLTFNEQLVQGGPDL